MSRKTGALRTILAVLCLASAGRAGLLQDAPSLDPAIAEHLTRLIEHERARFDIPAIAIVVTDGDGIRWKQGFGPADPATGRPIGDATLFRIGSVSKLFTDIAAMQLVESRKVDLDAPITTYLPDFAPQNLKDESITLRQLMAHRGGLVREPPVGHYFDLHGPSLAETVASLNSTELVHKRGTRTKYSNAGLAVVGYLVERLRGKPFAESVEETVLLPIGMTHSGFASTPERAAACARGIMWTYDGRRFPAPGFALGMHPAGDLYATLDDLGRFLIMLGAGGKGASGPVLGEATLRSMWEVQFAPKGVRGGFGLGFHVDDFDGALRVGHSGAVYGFATDVAALPDEKLGVAVISLKDCANATSRRIADQALRWLRAAKAGQPLPDRVETTLVPRDMARELAGRYGEGEGAVDLIERGGKLFAYTPRGGATVELRLQGNRLVVDDAVSSGPSIQPVELAIRIGGRQLERAPDAIPAPARGEWLGLIGEYGPDHDVLYILEKDGKLHALIEWFFQYPLEQESTDVYRFPDYGMYDNQRLIFTRDASGRATSVRAAEVVFDRRRLDGENGQTFRIKPTGAIAEIRASALAATPPSEPRGLRKPELVELTTLDPSIRLDVRYASDNNFLGTPLYTSARAFLQRPAADALVQAHRALAAHGYGLLIHDGYRPWHVTKIFWDAAPEEHHGFVANPARGSRHNRGCAVDLTLYDLKTGKPAEMVGGYDEFSPRSAPDYPGGTSQQRHRRDLLRRVMEDHGFTVNEVEWWHFDFKDWRDYPILDVPFEQI
jgi:CubicO group peptidase (beta-lactamase class C family)/D-alanyl-D-alanine dipeptidase